MINADSAQVYAGMRVVSAGPSDEDRAAAPHKLYATRDPALPCSAADWAAMAKEAISEARDAGLLPILVGGTGLYVRTLLEGIAPVPDIDPEIRAAIRASDVADNYAALKQADPERAAKLDAGDTLRVARALEVVRSTGKPMAHWQARKEGGIEGEVALSPLVLLPPREWLEARFEQRFKEMMDEGAVEEVAALLERDLDPDLPAMRAIGVREVAAFVRGEMTREEAIAAGTLATRQYAKRQYTWFRRQPPDDWPRFERALDDMQAMDEAVSILAGGL